MAKRIPRKPKTPLAGLKGKLKEITYGHAVRINLGHNSYSSIELSMGLSVDVAESADPKEVMEQIKHAVHEELLKTSESQKKVWMEELNIGPQRQPSRSRSKK